ncbi:MAG: prenyltransferase/squalene oxidase repeat-containing protein [Planctomycetota bacterium]|nr:prenyltransferase/squalene oxidase repeat-containing protein [Planctomycetota bacterium]
MRGQNILDSDRLYAAYDAACRKLLDAREPSGHWIGELSSSALSTATAVSALSVVRRESGTGDAREYDDLIRRGIEWLAACQSSDGGWGDTDKSRSNIATAMLVRAAFALAGAEGEHAEAMRAVDAYIDSQGRIDGLRRRFGDDKTFAVPILANCAIAGQVSWGEVSPLPFEAACLPHGAFRLLGLPVVSYAIPALVAIGQARYFHRPPRNPVTRMVRKLAVSGSLKTLRRMQPTSGGFLEAAPLTSFVTMSLAASERVDHAVVRQGAEFLTATVRPDGSWPIDTNLATWATTLAVGALPQSEQLSVEHRVGAHLSDNCLQWLLSCQHQTVHPFTMAAPGGWGWSDLDGAVPDADDTAGALLALSVFRKARQKDGRSGETEQILTAATTGLKWLLAIQNRDGGWPTFCRGWGKLPFDRSASDLTAHALRALNAWQKVLGVSKSSLFRTADKSASDGIVCGGGKLENAAIFNSSTFDRAIRRGWRYLEKTQRPDGSWVPLWFGNQHELDETNPIYGTSRVLTAYRDLGLMESHAAKQGIEWLAAQQNSDGGFGGNLRDRSSVEETALAVEALLAAAGATTGGTEERLQAVTDKGLRWLVEAVEQGRLAETSPIGFYFAKLWYYEKLYPVTFAVSALRQAVDCRYEL